MALAAGVDWIDLKNPNAGPLGRPEAELASDFAQDMENHPDRRWSIAGGELAEWDSNADRYFCQILGNHGFIKWALAGCGSDDSWLERLSVARNLLAHPWQAILVHYADWHDCDAPEWESVLVAASTLHMRYVLMDTAIKNGKGLFQHLSPEALKKRVSHARSAGIEVAIAGGLHLDQIHLGAELGAAWVGVRGAICANADRTSDFCAEKLEQAVAIVRGSATTIPSRNPIHVLR